MYKPLSLVLLLATLTGCQSLLRPADYDDPIVGFQCMLLTGKKPLEWDQIHHIQRYAGYGNARCKTALGILYENGGYGLSQDFDEARRLFTESAKTNPPSTTISGEWQNVVKANLWILPRHVSSTASRARPARSRLDSSWKKAREARRIRRAL